MTSTGFTTMPTPRFIQTGEVRTAVDIDGEGPPLLLMHGAEATRHMFAPLVPLLRTRFTVIAYDQRDCGDTEGPPHAATLAQLADDARALIEALGFARTHVFGTSFGGQVAQVFALRHADVLDRLVLGSTWPVPHPLGALDPEGAARVTALRQGLPDTAQELAAHFFPQAFLAAQPQLREVFARVRPGSERSLRRTQTTTDRPDGAAADIHAPTLLLAGALDRVVPPGITVQMAAQLRRAEVRLLPGIGHVAALQAPDVLAQAIAEFLRRPPQSIP